MDYDKDKVDEMTLALMFLVMSRVGEGGRAWKSFDAQTIERLHVKGWVANPNVKGATLDLTPEGLKKAEELFRNTFQGA
jgi:hypothetical protein